MRLLVFILLSILYIVSLVLVDGLFNRLIFREIRQLPYSHKEKQKIYKNWEWQWIGLILLVFLPMVLPSVVTFVLGGWNYLGVYWILFLLIQWDVVFGKLVFDNWWGDTPSIALPFFGWWQFGLKGIVRNRVLLALLIGLLLLSYNL